LSDQFFVLPGFAFFDEPGSANAFASPSRKLGRSDGDVLFGRKLFRKIISRRERPEIVVSLCAHEFGHIARYKYDVYNRLVGLDRRKKRLELHADFLSGYFAGIRKLERADYLAASAAVVAGYRAGYDEKLKFGYALESGIRYVKQIRM
jgi:hypothetical protein